VFLKNEVIDMSEYSIATFLEVLAEDDLEKEIIKLVSKGLTNEELLERILKIIRGREK